MKDDPDASHIRDSTVNANHGTKKAANEPIEADGMIGKAQDFDGSNDYIGCGGAANLRILADVTVEFWMRADSLTSNPRMVVFGEDGETEAVNVLYGVVINSDGTVQVQHEYEAGRNEFHSTSSAYISINTQYQVVAVRDDANKHWKVYVNGDYKETLPYTNSATGGSSGKLWIGSWLGNEYFFNGIIDEVRISNVARSDAWIKATYETERDNLLTWGSEETAAVTLSVSVLNESLDKSRGIAGETVTYTATVQDENGNALPSTFKVTLKIDDTILIQDQPLTSDVYDPATKKLTLQWTVPAMNTFHTVKLVWSEQTINTTTYSAGESAGVQFEIIPIPPAISPEQFNILVVTLITVAIIYPIQTAREYIEEDR